MSSVAGTFELAEQAISDLSPDERLRLFRRFSGRNNGDWRGIEKNDKILGGAACIQKTRIPVWLLYHARKQNVSESELLRNYPGLKAEDLVNAWNYADANSDELEEQIRLNDSDEE